jgi:hypothetical protein
MSQEKEVFMLNFQPGNVLWIPNSVLVREVKSATLLFLGIVVSTTLKEYPGLAVVLTAAAWESLSGKKLGTEKVPIFLLGENEHCCFIGLDSSNEFSFKSIADISQVVDDIDIIRNIFRVQYISGRYDSYLWNAQCNLKFLRSFLENRRKAKNQASAKDASLETKRLFEIFNTGIPVIEHQS